MKTRSGWGTSRTDAPAIAILFTGLVILAIGAGIVGGLLLSIPGDETGFENGPSLATAMAQENEVSCEDIDYAGNGTAENPYEIGTLEELYCVRDSVLEDAHWQLVSNIDASATREWNDGQGWEPIGQNTPFVGVFDGQGHRIDGLYIDRPSEDNVGLFGQTATIGGGSGPDDSLVKNIRLHDVEVYGNSHVGGLAGQIGGTLENVSVTGYVEAERQRVGLITGRGGDADLTNQLAARGTVVGGDASGTARGIGGIVGRTSWDTEVDFAYAQTRVVGDREAGGLIGSTSQNPSHFEEMYAASTVMTRDDENATAGVFTGLIENSNDIIENSVYWDEQRQREWLETGESQGVGVDETDGTATNNMQARSTAKMQGLHVDHPDRLGELTFTDDGGPWVAVEDDYPRFEWEILAEEEHDEPEEESSDLLLYLLLAALAVGGYYLYRR